MFFIIVSAAINTKQVESLYDSYSKKYVSTKIEVGTVSSAIYNWSNIFWED